MENVKLEMLINLILNGVSILFIGAVSYFIRRTFKNYDERINTLEGDVKEMKVNYTDKFLDVKEHVSEKIDKVFKQLSDIKEAIVRQATKCETIQELKKQEILNKK